MVAPCLLGCLGTPRHYPVWVRLVSSEGSRSECVLALGCAWVKPLVFAGQVVVPVVVVVAVGDDGAQGDGLPQRFPDG
jgi:hypothetical protein